MKFTGTLNIYLTALLSIILLITGSCKKDDNIKHGEGTIINMGNPAADGCGWIIRIDHVDYKPENLDSSFEQDSLKVKVDYRILQSRYSCGIVANIGFSYIHIDEIKKK